ncbi:MAG: SH3 domain-containing protein [Kiritimatiellota bacterium]|nr:SH3 domain-containing protein [Kiritimatiellota bacterium]
MKRLCVIMLTVAGLCLSGGAQTAALTRVKVLKNNCNLRAKALVTSEVVGQVSENDILTAKMIDKEWVEVVPPANVDLWVLGDYVKDGAINCSQKVNVRAGAGINFNIVGQLPQGEKVEVRGTHAEWIKIAPLPACSLWISRSLVSEVPLTYVEPAKLEAAKAEPVKPWSPMAPPEAGKLGPVRGKPRGTRGKPDKWSDIDVAIFMEGAEKMGLQRRAQLSAMIQREAGDDLELHFFTKDMFDHPAPASFAKFVMTKGLHLT